jgi:pyridinium-3,5-bisthiocarboxylic acid mononucleotide nickel chelatase
VSRCLYIDAVGGVAGDMLLAALIDAGAPIAELEAGLPVSGVSLSVERVNRCGMEAALLTISGAHEHHPHRRWGDVRELIDAGAMTGRASDRAHEAFARLARAEGKVHGISPEEVMFHEVGALDAIVDICGVALALEALQIDSVVCSPLPMGTGTTVGAHGILPLPAPATLELLTGAVIAGTEQRGETVTPTGAALVASLGVDFGPIPRLRLESVGSGAGRRDSKTVPNVTRALVGERLAAIGGSEVSVIETNLDDLLPELVPDAMQACFAAGALDVWTVLAGMKNSRPGIVFSALARPADEARVQEAVLRHTTALGVRVHRGDRFELERRWETVEVGGHPVSVKLGLLDGVVVNAAPEHRDCERVAHDLERPTIAVWSAAFSAANSILMSDSETTRGS